MQEKKDYRFDSRTQEQFANDIKRSSTIESWLMELFAGEKRYSGIDFKYRDFGCDNSGEYLTKYNSRPDYIVEEAGLTYFVEVKQNPQFKYSTFKVSALNSCLKWGSHILLFHGVNTKSAKIEDTDFSKVRWSIFGPDVVGRLLELPAKEYFGINGGRPSVQILYKQYDDYFSLQTLKHLGF